MKKLLVLLCTLILFTGCSGSANSTQAELGDTRTDVEQIENAHNIADVAIGFDNTTFAEVSGCMEIYSFDSDNKVEEIVIMTSAIYDDPSLYLTDFESFVVAFTDMYGEPTTNETTWLNDTHENDPHFHGTALKYGHFVQIATWETPEASVSVMLMGGDAIGTTALITSSK